MLDSVLEELHTGGVSETPPAPREAFRRAPTPIAVTLPSEATPMETPAATPAPRFNGFTFDNPLTAHLVVAPEIQPSAVEQYRKLATVLHHAQTERNIKVITVAGAMPSDGKTLTATNLALTLSNSFRRRVLLIDADLRKPSLQQIFSAPVGTGLSQALTATSERRLQVLQPSAHLSVLLAGTPEGDPVTGLSSERMRHIIEDAASHFDWVILDTPPAASLPDAKLVSALVDGVLLVVRAGVTPYPAVERALEAVGRNRVLGVVLNAAEAFESHGYGYGYNYGAGAESVASAAASGSGTLLERS
jgi:capsular exopolysaccharide synthesis family protein